jgi:hypothetical protein
MKLLLHNQISDTFDEIKQDPTDFFLQLYEYADFNNYPAVNFNMDNATCVDLDYNECIDYLKANNVDVDDILLVSTLLCDGYIKAMRNYRTAIESVILK